MITQLKKHGNEISFELEEELIQKINLSNGQEIDIEVTAEGSIILSKADKESNRKEKINSAFAELSTKYSGALKRLAE